MIIPATITWILTIGLINYLRKKESAKFQSEQQSRKSNRNISPSNRSSARQKRDAEKDISMRRISKGYNVTTDGSEVDEDREMTTKREWKAVAQNDDDEEIGDELEVLPKKMERSDAQPSTMDYTGHRKNKNQQEQQPQLMTISNSLISTISQFISNPPDRTTVYKHLLENMNNYIFPVFMVPLFILEFVGVVPLTGLFIFITVSMVSIHLIVSYYHPIDDRPVSNNSDTVSVVEEGKALTEQQSGLGNTQLSRLTTRSMVDMTPRERIQHISQQIEELFHELDYNLLIIFTGLFIVSGSFVATNIPGYFWKAMAGNNAFQTSTSIVVISIYIIGFSQLVGNVPVVYMARDEVQELDRQPQIFGWLILAFVSTIAGNFTLVGSAANIIVVEKAMRHPLYPVYIHAKEHFLICGLITIISIVLGVIALSLEMAITGG